MWAPSRCLRVQRGGRPESLTQPRQVAPSHPGNRRAESLPRGNTRSGRAAGQPRASAASTATGRQASGRRASVRRPSGVGPPAPAASRATRRRASVRRPSGLRLGRRPSGLRLGRRSFEPAPPALDAMALTARCNDPPRFVARPCGLRGYGLLEPRSHLPTHAVPLCGDRVLRAPRLSSPASALTFCVENGLRLRGGSGSAAASRDLPGSCRGNRTGGPVARTALSVTSRSRDAQPGCAVRPRREPMASFGPARCTARAAHVREHCERIAVRLRPGGSPLADGACRMPGTAGSRRPG